MYLYYHTFNQDFRGRHCETEETQSLCWEQHNGSPEEAHRSKINLCSRSNKQNYQLWMQEQWCMTSKGHSLPENFVFVVPKRLEATDLEYIRRNSVEQKPDIWRAQRMKKKTTVPLTSILRRNIPNSDGAVLLEQVGFGATH